MMVHVERRPQFTSAQFGLTVALLVLLFIMALAAITREAVGEPIVPPQISQLFHQQAAALPDGLTYDFSVVDPATQQRLYVLPADGTVELRLAVSNDSALPMSLHFPTSEQVEFISRHVNTYVWGLFALPLEVWRSSYFHNVQPTPTHVDLAPGQTKVFVAYWTYGAGAPEQAPEGDYRLLAQFYGVTFPLRIDKPI